jgi:pyridoxamine 5'-phosphate oxidase family protein
MPSFSPAEVDYLTSERRLGRLATVDAAGMPHVVPVGWRYNEQLGTIDISGREFAASRKFRNVQATAKAAFVVDDMASVNPWRPRAVMVRGRAEALVDAPGEALIRIQPDNIVSWGLAAD